MARSKSPDGPTKASMSSMAWAKAHPEQFNEASARWRANHREAERQRVAAWRAVNREKARESSKRWAQENPEKVQAIYARRKSNNPNQWNEWAHANPERVQVIRHRRRARRLAVPVNDLTAQQWKAIKAHYKQRCVYCGEKSKRLTQDHITPLAQGGSHTAQNVVPSCKPCNSKKGTRGPLKPIQPLLLI